MLLAGSEARLTACNILRIPMERSRAPGIPTRALAAASRGSRSPNESQTVYAKPEQSKPNAEVPAHRYLVPRKRSAVATVWAPGTHGSCSPSNGGRASKLSSIAGPPAAPFAPRLCRRPGVAVTSAITAHSAAHNATVTAIAVSR